MPKPGRRVLGLFSVVAVVSVLLRLDAGEVIQALALTAIYSVLLWGM
jgi:2-methylcitrate dehydratase PrpD